MGVVDLVDRHPPDPSDRVVVAADLAPLEMGFHERLLDRVGCHLRITGDQRQRPDQARVMGGEERVEVVHPVKDAGRRRRRHRAHR